METISLDEFYRDSAAVLPAGINKEIGHFNVFKTDEFIARANKTGTMPYNRRAYYKVSLIKGHNRAEYVDKVIEIAHNGLLFATPKIPYNYVSLDDKQAGYFCIFTDAFLTQRKSGVILDDLPIFKPGGYPVFQVSDADAQQLEAIFRKMHAEMASDYAYKYDLLRTYLLELIHFGQKLQPASQLHTKSNAAARVTSLFIELLERQFPIESPGQKLHLRTPHDYAGRLAIHVNHLNKMLKDSLGKTTTEFIAGRIVQEAKILLRQTDWNISEIAYSLGFEELAHFSNFFRKHAHEAPQAYRAGI